MNEARTQAIALFRYQVIAPLLSLPPERGRLRKEMQALAEKTWEVPGSERSRIGYGTIEEWYYRYRNGGLPAITPARRGDAAHSRAISPEAALAIEELLTAHPRLTGPNLLKELTARGLRTPDGFSLSSFYRHKKAQGLDRLTEPARRDLRAYEFDFAGDCWQSDILFGPTLATPDGRRRKTYLYAVLDDATRLIPHAQFYFDQHLACLKDTLQQAVLKRGLPKRLYVDNGMVFRSKNLLQAAAQLGFALLYTRPYKPQGRAKLERWFLTVRKAFLGRLEADLVTDLAHLNRLLWAWIEGEYHTTLHKGIGETPLDRWLRLAEHVRPAPADLDLERVFLSRVQRRVKRDGTFTIDGKSFEAGVRFVGDKIDVRYHPFDLRRVLISRDGVAEAAVYPLDREANRHARRDPEPVPQVQPEVRLTSLERLAAERSQAGDAPPSPPPEPPQASAPEEGRPA